jgi:hypothetical protein
MTTEQYIGRDMVLSDTLPSSSGGTKCYILHPRNDPDVNHLGLRSHLEDGPISSLFISSPSGTLEVSACSIANVFTNLRFRRRGMATFLPDAQDQRSCRPDRRVQRAVQ